MMSSKRKDRFSSMVNTIIVRPGLDASLFELSDPESDCRVRACSLVVRDERLLPLLVGLAAAAAAASASAINLSNWKRFHCAVVVTATHFISSILHFHLIYQASQRMERRDPEPPSFSLMMFSSAGV